MCKIVIVGQTLWYTWEEENTPGHDVLGNESAVKRTSTSSGPHIAPPSRLLPFLKQRSVKFYPLHNLSNLNYSAKQTA